MAVGGGNDSVPNRTLQGLLVITLKLIARPHCFLKCEPCLHAFVAFRRAQQPAEFRMMVKRVVGIRERLERTQKLGMFRHRQEVQRCVEPYRPAVVAIHLFAPGITIGFVQSLFGREIERIEGIPSMQMKIAKKDAFLNGSVGSASDERGTKCAQYRRSGTALQEYMHIATFHSDCERRQVMEKMNPSMHSF